MKRIVFAGIIYLIVIAIILTIKPKFMFTEDGVWKEFGIGRNPATHTWMPFWLFSILLALICYILVTIVLSFFHNTPSSPQDTSSIETQSMLNTAKKSVRNRSSSFQFEVEPNDAVTIKNTSYKSRLKGKSLELPDGYYILNSKATEESGGIPKYIFLGKGLPEES